MNVNFVWKLKIASHDGDNDGGIFTINATFNVSSVTSRQGMTGHFFDQQSGKEKK
jgi:hypothetical protein